MLKFIMSHKKGLLKALAALAMAVAAVLYLVEGDQKEAAIEGAAKKVSEFADKLPADEAAAEAPAAE
jgi:hypothetical protein